MLETGEAVSRRGVVTCQKGGEGEIKFQEKTECCVSRTRRHVKDWQELGGQDGDIQEVGKL